MLQTLFNNMPEKWKSFENIFWCLAQTQIFLYFHIDIYIIFKIWSITFIIAILLLSHISVALRSTSIHLVQFRSFQSNSVQTRSVWT